MAWGGGSSLSGARQSTQEIEPSGLANADAPQWGLFRDDTVFKPIRSHNESRSAMHRISFAVSMRRGTRGGGSSETARSGFTIVVVENCCNLAL